MSHEQELKELCAEYGATLPVKLADIRSDWNRLLQQADQTLFKEVIRKVHSLVGAGATFGFSLLSTTAEKLELELRQYQEQAKDLVDYADRFEHLFKALEKSAQQTPDYNVSADTLQPIKIADIVRDEVLSIMIISSNQSFKADLSNRLTAFNITCHVPSSASDLLAEIEKTRPSCIVVELTTVQNQAIEIKSINDIKQGLFNAPPLIVIANYHDMAIHLSAVRAGASAFFPAPVNIAELVTCIQAQSQSGTEPPYRILIIDDDEQFAHHTALILQRAGMSTSVLTKPLNILEPLSQFNPEVILLDLYMPECDGIELATVIRQQLIYTGITIVFFSVETDIERHIDALRTGGNDFFVKTMSPKQLIVKVEAKAKNARAVQRMMLRDGLTGLLNRCNFTETLNQKIAISQRSKGCFSYVMLDLDHFKQINDQYGHQAGDEVLRSLAALLTQRLRSVDSVIRYGGEELVILLSDTNAEQAEPLVNELLKKFSALKFSVNDQSFSATFSAGIAQYPTYSDPSCLAEAADKALYEAKVAGRNRVRLALTT